MFLLVALVTVVAPQKRAGVSAQVERVAERLEFSGEDEPNSQFGRRGVEQDAKRAHSDDGERTPGADELVGLDARDKLSTDHLGPAGKEGNRVVEGADMSGEQCPGHASVARSIAYSEEISKNSADSTRLPSASRKASSHVSAVTPWRAWKAASSARTSLALIRFRMGDGVVRIGANGN